MDDAQFSIFMENEHRKTQILERHTQLLERIAGDKAPPEPVAAALAQVFGSDNFTSAEAMEAACTAATAAEAVGQRLPDLPCELRRFGITNPHALGRHLAKCEGVAKIGRDRGATIWQTKRVFAGS